MNDKETIVRELADDCDTEQVIKIAFIVAGYEQGQKELIKLLEKE